MFMTFFLVLISTARSSTNFPKPTKNSVEKHLPVIINDETNLEPEPCQAKTRASTLRSDRSREQPVLGTTNTPS